MAPLTQVGILSRVSESGYFGANNFEKRKFVLEVPADDSQYPSQFIEFELTQKRCELVANFNIGDEIEVYFNLKGNKHKPTNPDGSPKLDENGKPITNVYNSLNAWRLSSQTQEGQPAPQDQQNNGLNNEQNNPQHGVIELNLGQNSAPAQNNNPQQANVVDDSIDDIPFSPML